MFFIYVYFLHPAFSGIEAFKKCVKAKIEVCDDIVKMKVWQFLEIFIEKIKDKCYCKLTPYFVYILMYMMIDKFLKLIWIYSFVDLKNCKIEEICGCISSERILEVLISWSKGNADHALLCGYVLLINLFIIKINNIFKKFIYIKL